MAIPIVTFIGKSGAGSDHVIIASPDKIASYRLIDREPSLDEIAFAANIRSIFRFLFHRGLTAFGGPSLVTYIRKMSVDQKGWRDLETFNIRAFQG
jgi:hypothetical protein